MSRSPFSTQANALHTLIARREEACERIERRLLNVKGKPISRTRERQPLVAVLEECCFEGLSRETARVCTQLAEAHVADGFEPFLQHGRPHQLDAAQSIVHAYEHWERTRWPGASGRLHHARVVWAVFLLRHLQDLTLRIWDEHEDLAPSRMREIQGLLDQLNAVVPAAVLVRDARWLMQVAQGPLTRGLAPYFRVAERIRRSFTSLDAVAIHAAGAMLAGGHLRSQVRHRAADLQHPPHAVDVLAVTRNSNAMDLALLVWDLVPLLAAYAGARGRSEWAARRALAAAIVQGVSADPELLATRLDLLAPYTIVETVFVQIENGGAEWTPTGRTHRQIVDEYAALLDELAPALLEDAAAMEPAAGVYSPLGMEYGFCGDLLANMASDGLRGAGVADVSLEDLFDPGGDAARKQSRARVAYSAEWACDVFAVTRRALQQRANNRGRANASATPAASLRIALRAEDPPPDAQEYCITSDVNLALATGATAFPRGQIVTDRNEGRFLASAETNGRWFGVSKMVLERLARGEDATMTVPGKVARILELTCPTIEVAGMGLGAGEWG